MLDVPLGLQRASRVAMHIVYNTQFIFWVCVTQLVLPPWVRTLDIFIFPSVPAPMSLLLGSARSAKRDPDAAEVQEIIKSASPSSSCAHGSQFPLPLLSTGVVQLGLSVLRLPRFLYPCPTGSAHPHPLPLPGQPSPTNQHIVQQVTGMRFCDPPTRLHAFWWSLQLCCLWILDFSYPCILFSFKANRILIWAFHFCEPTLRHGTWKAEGILTPPPCSQF